MLTLGLIFWSGALFLNKFEINIAYVFMKLLLFLGFIVSLYLSNFFKIEEIRMAKSLFKKIILVRT